MVFLYKSIIYYELSTQHTRLIMSFKNYTIPEAISLINLAPDVKGIATIKLLYKIPKVDEAKSLKASLLTPVTASIPISLWRFRLCDELEKASQQWNIAFPDHEPHVALAIDPKNDELWINRPNVDF